MDSSIYETDETVVTHASRRKEDVLRVVVTDGSSDIALSFLYRILSDEVFGPDQSIFVSIYEFPGKAVFLESIAIELTLCSPNLLHGKPFFKIKKINDSSRKDFISFLSEASSRLHSNCNTVKLLMTAIYFTINLSEE